MTDTTPVYGIPYLEGSDALSTLPAAVQALAEAVESSLAGFGGIASPGSWTTPGTILAGTSHGAGYADAKYRKVGSWVSLRGVLDFGGGLTAGDDLFVLPSGFRPLAHEGFAVSSSVAGAHVDVLSTGHVRVQTTIGAGGFVSLSGVTFAID